MSGPSAGAVKARARVPRRAPPLRAKPAVEAAAAVRALRIQPALTVGGADDPAEREAEAMADRVVAMPAPVAAPAPPADPAPPAARRTAGDQPSLDAFEQEPPLPAEQADVEVPPARDVDAAALDAGDMAELETGQPADTGGDTGGEPGEGAGPPDGDAEARPLRRAAAPAVVGPRGGAAPPEVAARVAQPGPGRPLPAPTRAFMEPRFGRDFSAVRLHDAPEDRRAARRIGARAFTLGRRIWLGEGESAADRRLMAHELTHVVQQTGPAGPARRETIRRGLIADEAEGYARQVPGYTLVCVLLGESPITGRRVPRTAETLIGGFMGLIPGGTLLFDRLKEARVLQEAHDWVAARLSQLDITWTRVRRLIGQVWDAFPTLSPLREVRRIFGPLVEDVLTFARDIRDKVLEFIVRGALRLAGPWGERVWGVIRQAGAAISMILEDPLGFARNLIAAVLNGFGRFRDNILDHLKRGLMGWLFGALATAGIELPARLDFRGLISLVLQILGLTYQQFRKRLVKALGRGGERKVAFLERSVEVVGILMRDGFLGLWQTLLGMIDGFRQTLIGGLKDLVITSVVRAALGWLAGLANPAGAIVKVCLAIYDMIVVFLERLEQIRQFVGAIFSSVAAIARGQVAQAAAFIERSLGAAVPLVISFLAAILGLNTIPQKIRQVIERLRRSVTRALDRMLAFLIRKAKALLSRLTARLNAARRLPSHGFRIGRTAHRIFAQKAGRKVEVRIASGTPRTLAEVEACIAAERAKLKDEAAKREAGEIGAEAAETKQETADDVKKVDLASQKTPMGRALKGLDAELKKAAADLGRKGADTASHPEIDTASAACLIRVQEPRSDKVEGEAGSHSAVKAVTGQPMSPASKLKWSTFVESDHVMEKQFPKAIADSLATLDPAGAKAVGGEAPVIRHAPGAPAPGAAAAEPKPFGLIGDPASGLTPIGDEAVQYPALAVHRGIHKAKARPAQGPDAMIAAAARTEDPHAALRRALQAQFAAEAGSVRALYAKDKGAPETVRTRVAAGLDRLAEENARIYGFAAKGAKAAATRASRTAAAPEGSQSQITFAPKAGEENRPDLRRIEGKGGPYVAARAARETFGRFGHLIQYDHIVEKSLPLGARALGFADGGLKQKARAKAEAAAGDRPLARPRALDGKALFLRTAPLHGYTVDTGYAVPIYKPIHDLASQARYSDPSAEAILADAPGDLVDAAATALDAPDADAAAAGIEAARTAAARHFRARFQRRVAEHAKIVADGYAGELRSVPALNPAPLQTQARQAMAGIAANVAASLREAAGKSDALFPG